MTVYHQGAVLWWSAVPGTSDKRRTMSLSRMECKVRDIKMQYYEAGAGRP
jgi:hypothetical protein